MLQNNVITNGDITPKKEKEQAQTIKRGFGALHLSFLFIFNDVYQNIGAMLLVLQ